MSYDEICNEMNEIITSQLLLIYIKMNKKPSVARIADRNAS